MQASRAVPQVPSGLRMTRKRRLGAIHLDPKDMEIAVADLGNGYAHQIILRREQLRLRRRGRHAGVNEIRGERQNYGEESDRGGKHPAALLAALPGQPAALRLVRRRQRIRGVARERQPFAKNYQCSGTQNHHEKKYVVAHDRAHQCHFAFTRGKPHGLA